ncbi:MAG: hypothetical protein WC782_08560 [Methylococcaceae bacterium]|jgi:hypothetical protein
MRLIACGKVLNLVFISSLVIACSSEPVAPPPLAFNVVANTQSNNGGLFYFVVRGANEKQFMQDSYQEVAGKVFADPPEANSLGVFSIVPGRVQECKISPPAQGTVALYFLLTQPGAQWKKLLSTPLANKYTINVTATNQVEISEGKPWYLSWF